MRELGLEFTVESDPDQTPSILIPSIRKAVEYLKKQGYKATKSSVHNHVKAGLVTCSSTGTFDSKDLDRYAMANLDLVNADENNPEQQHLQKLQREKLETTTSIAKEQLRLLERRNSDIDVEITQRISSEIVNFLNLQRNVVTNYFTTEAPALIELVHGDQKYAPEFIAATREGIGKSGVVVARLKGVDVRVAPDGTLLRGDEVIA